MPSRFEMWSLGCEAGFLTEAFVWSQWKPTFFLDGKDTVLVYFTLFRLAPKIRHTLLCDPFGFCFPLFSTQFHVVVEVFLWTLQWSGHFLTLGVSDRWPCDLRMEEEKFHDMNNV